MFICLVVYMFSCVLLFIETNIAYGTGLLLAPGSAQGKVLTELGSGMRFSNPPPSAKPPFWMPPSLYAQSPC